MIRKVISALALSTVIAAVPAAAQTQFGVVGGVSSAKTTVSGEGLSVTFDSRTGFAAGVSMSRPVANGIEFAPELLYIQKGFEVSSGGESAGTKVAYVEVPLLFRAKFGKATGQPFVIAGPAIGVKASCKVTASSDGTSGETDCGENSDEGLKSFDFGVMVGGGIAFNRLSVSIRYDLGLANTIKGADAGVSYKNKALLALVGIAL